MLLRSEGRIMAGASGTPQVRRPAHHAANRPACKCVHSAAMIITHPPGVYPSYCIIVVTMIEFKKNACRKSIMLQPAR